MLGKVTNLFKGRFRTKKVSQIYSNLMYHNKVGLIFIFRLFVIYQFVSHNRSIIINSFTIMKSYLLQYNLNQWPTLCIANFIDKLPF